MYIPLGLLRRHVLESNQIEGYRIQSGLPLYRSHLQAALAIARQPLWEMPLHPRKIHEILCRETEMNYFGGFYRSCPVWVGRQECPRVLSVEPLMREWWNMVEQSFTEQHLSRSAKALDFTAQFLHEWLLCIHPFEDGNGRTARLFLNALRMRYGLDWIVIEAKLRWKYYAGIRRTGRVFKKEYPDVY